MSLFLDPFPLPAKQDLALTEPLEDAYLEMHAAGTTVHRARFPFGGEGWMVTGFEEVRQVLADDRFGIERAAQIQEYPRIRQIELGRPFPPSFNEYDPPKHTTKRAVLMKHLTVRRVNALRPATEVIVETQLDKFEQLGQGADMSEIFAREIPLLVFGHLMGIPEDEFDLFIDAAHTFSNSSAVTREDAAVALNTLKDYFRELVKRRQVEPGDDLISALVNDTFAAEKWTQSELEGIGMVLLMAGHDATGAMLGGILEWVSHDPVLYDQLRAAPDSFPMMLNELLRFLPAGLSGTRTRIAYEDIQVGDVLIKEGESVLPIVHAANFDPSNFPEPTELVFDRSSDNPHVAFGHGAHACVGQQLARMEIDVAMRAVLHRYDKLEHVNNDPDWQSQRLLRGPKQIPVNFRKVSENNGY